jgi:hypothetical protein
MTHRSIALVSPLLLALLWSALPTAAYTPPHLHQDQLAHLVTPIALYPDTLLLQVLGAAEDPSQVVAVGDYLCAPAGQQPMDPAWTESVQALCQYPTVVALMDAQLAWTARLGNAYQAQRADVIHAVHGVRTQARAVGNLESNDKQELELSGDAIKIVSVDPDLVYVPRYDPAQIFAKHAADDPLITYGAPVDPTKPSSEHDHHTFHHHTYDDGYHFKGYKTTKPRVLEGGGETWSTRNLNSGMGGDWDYDEHDHDNDNNHHHHHGGGGSGHHGGGGHHHGGHHH